MCKDQFLEMDRRHRYMRRLKTKLLMVFGSKCQNLNCNSVSRLEFAHKDHNVGKVHGAGRGMGTRYRDVQKYPELYMLLCHECHLIYDSMQEQLGSHHGITKQVQLEIEYLQEIKHVNLNML